MPSYAESPFERIVNVHWKKKKPPDPHAPPWQGIEGDYSCYWPNGTSAAPNYGGLDLSSGIFSYWYRYPFGGIAPPPEEVNDYGLQMLVGGRWADPPDPRFADEFSLGGRFPGGPYNIGNGYGLFVTDVDGSHWSLYQTDCAFSSLPHESWHHIISAWNGDIFQCYVDGVNRRTDDIHVGGGAVPGVYDVVTIGYPVLQNSLFFGLLSNIYFAAGQFLDLRSNIQKFRDPTTGNPVYLGLHARLPTGIPPTLWSPTPISNYRGDASGHPNSKLPNEAIDGPSDWTVHSLVNGSIPVSNLSFAGIGPVTKPWWPGQPV